MPAVDTISIVLSILYPALACLGVPHPPVVKFCFANDRSEIPAMRTTWEELGIDLADKEWLTVGQMDDREITTSLGKRLLMVSFHSISHVLTSPGADPNFYLRLFRPLFSSALHRIHSTQHPRMSLMTQLLHRPSPRPFTLSHYRTCFPHRRLGPM